MRRDAFKPEACIETLGKHVLSIVSEDALKTEVCIEPLGIYFVLKILANPKRGYVVCIKPIIVLK